MKFDIHVHTNHTDGIATPEEMVKQAAKIVDGVAITDHDTMDGVAKAKKAAKKYGIKFIPGVEISTPSGDILAIGIQEMPKTDEILEIFDNIHQQGGVAILAHPFAGFWQLSFANIIELLKGQFDAIEVYNASTPMPANAEAAKLAKRIGMVGVAGSDAHFVEMVGSAYTISDDSDIVKAIKKGDVKVGWV
jgi:hypothetical protein